MLLELHMFLKKKRDGNINGWKVYGGNKQQMYIPKEDASYTNISTEYVLLISIIYAE